MSKVVVLGEVMLDYYTYGVVNRINPEAPTLILEAKNDFYTLGGAGNVAKNLVGLGIKSVLVTITRNDSAGRKVERLAKKHGIKLVSVQDDRPTIIKHRFIAMGYNQQLLRVDREERNPISKKYAQQLARHIKKINPDLIIVSDYGKGLITSELMKELNKYKSRMIVDPKPKNIDLYKDVLLIKPNLKEASAILGRTIENTDREVERAGKELLKKYKANIVITRGEKGATLIKKDKVYNFEALAREVHDVSGAGDTFIATIGYGLLNKQSLEEAVDLANKAASIVVGKLGTVAIKREELENYEDILSKK